MCVRRSRPAPLRRRACALALCVPASIASSLSAGARRGLLMKGGAVIEATAKVTKVAFDKTGTLTHGRPVVTDVIAFDGVTEAELLAVAAGGERRGEVGR